MSDTPGTSLATTDPKMGGALQALVPQSISEVQMMAAMIVTAGWAPKHYRKDPKVETSPFDEAKIALGIMTGLEVGLKPIQALQGIAVINGMPSIYGDAALALVRSSGLLEDFKETPILGNRTAAGENRGDRPVELKGVIVGYHCWAKRKGQETPIEFTFTVEMAITAKLWGKTGPWTDHPGRMLQMRARSWVLRDGFTEVLKGLGIAEEVQDIAITVLNNPPDPKGATKGAVSGRAGASNALDAFAGGKAAGKAEPAPEAAAGVVDAEFTEVGIDDVQVDGAAEVQTREVEGAEGELHDLPVMPTEVEQAVADGRWSAFFSWFSTALHDLPSAEAKQVFTDAHEEELRSCRIHSDKNAAAVDGLLTHHNVTLALNA